VDEKFFDMNSSSIVLIGRVSGAAHGNQYTNKSQPREERL
jgi:hypothetical protein